MSHLRTRLLALTCAAAAVLSTTGVTSAESASAQALAGTHPGLARLLAGGTPTGRAIVELPSVPTAAQVSALRGLGLTVQPMHRLPMALVQGSVAQITSAVTSGIGTDVYPDEQLQYTDTASSDAMSSTVGAAKALRAKGFTGKGETVGIIDSGCDGTHPDLADHITHNVTLYSPEYANQGTDPTLVVPIDQGPFNNTDLGSGHGTHVAGIIAADGTTSPDHLGVAPDADLACFAIGAVITTTAVVTAFDYILDQPDLFSIDVINNSWGNSFRQYDPQDPVNVATKAVSDKGVVVVFAAGNSGSDSGEASVSPFNQAPWVISVAAGSLKRERADFSSNGLEVDNGKAVPIGADGHTVLTGDRIGNTQPDVMAPGSDISSSCDTTGTVIGPCPPGENASASGTSMASPHIAGAAAVLLQANRHLSVGQVQDAIKATASPVKAGDKTLGSWQVGYGHINLDKAVALVRGSDWRADLRAAKQRADHRLAGQDAWAVTRADLWQEDAPPASVGGSYTATHTVTVASGVSALKVALVYPTPGTAFNAASFTATVTDAAGKEVGVTTTDLLYTTGIAHVLVKGVKPGAYTITVTGDYAASDPDTLDSDSVNGRVVFLQAAQLRRR
ncbi:serine protease AprX [Nocardioides ginsengisegetis]|uniref:Serine protease AprX n=1 Tax=Nocardioides ginsengisegetis TaxID=661491 RepID=A0A7W3P8I7_9ACTN|nr:S8 family serine peptidase [Nocardioides ginsengisegetis]MBA8802650.1 serine protease AprX [Nocardioides ginsengisegetis]